MEIYLQVDNDTLIVLNIVDWGKERNCNIAVANMALHDGFIKESAFDYPMPKKYKDLCSVYSDEYFRLFNRRKI